MVACFTHSERARSYVEAIRGKLPRYTRDHLQCILKALKGASKDQAEETLEFCLTHELYSGAEFEQVLRVQANQPKVVSRPDPIKLLHTDVVEKARQAPQTSNLDDYETILNPNDN